MSPDLFASLLLGSSLSVILAPQFIRLLHFNFFSPAISQAIPSLTPEIIVGKNLDFTDFIFTAVLSVLIFLVNSYWNKKTKTLDLINYWYLAFAGLIFFQTHFVFTSAAPLIILVIITQAVYLLTKIFRLQPQVHFDWTTLANGVLTGFYLLLLANKFTTVPAALFFLLASAIFFYISFPHKVFARPGHLLLLLSLINPLSVPWLITVGIVSLLFILFVNRIPAFINHYLYPLTLIFLFAYNPLYYVGNFDSVEEGFWAAWNQRLYLGQVPYRDFLSYHPPVLLWGLHLFSLIFGFSLRHQKIFFHLSQIAGLVSFYFLSRPLVKNPFHRILLVFTALGFSGIFVSNNFEIRLGMGLLAILFWHYKKPFLSGVFTALAVLTSMEIGLVTTVVMLLANRRALPHYLLGCLIVVVPVFTYLYFNGALPEFFSQMTFYSRAFSSGYFNTPVERQFTSSSLSWQTVDRYLSSGTPFYWEICRLVIFGSFIFSGYQMLRSKTSPVSALLLVISSFGLLMFRSALGRSDYYHLLPLIWLSLLLIVAILDKYTPLIFLTLILIFSRQPVVRYLDAFITRSQSYARPVGEWRQFASSRSGLLMGQTVDTLPVNLLLDYLNLHTAPSDGIFVYPWNPELYFLANRKNVTALDTPYAFFLPRYQQQTISQLRLHPPKFIIYHPEKTFGNMGPDSLPLLTGFILDQYPRQLAVFGNYRLLTSAP